MISKEYKKQIEKIQRDKTSGAEELLEQALTVLDSEIQENHNNFFGLEQIIPYLEEIIKIKEEMILFRNIAIQFLKMYTDLKPVKEIIPSILVELKKQKKYIKTFFVEWIKQYSTIITISRSSTLVDCFSEIPEKKRTQTIIVSEFRPNNEGALFAKEMIKLGFNVIYGVDAATNHFFEEYPIDIALIGADSIYSNGDAINKIGSKALGFFAKEKKVSLVVVCTTNKIMLENRKLIFDKYPPKEVWGEEQDKNIRIVNPYFEKIQKKLISGYLTEIGYNQKRPILEKIAIPDHILNRIYPDEKKDYSS